jgi:hypothetical protein
MAPAIVGAAVLTLVPACSPTPESVDGEVPASASRAASEASGRDAAVVHIPARFQGEWQRDRGRCGNADESRLLIGPESIRFHESVGTLQALHADEGRLDVALRLRGEGQAWEATYRFVLSSDGSRLTDLSSGNGLVRLRCT